MRNWKIIAITIIGILIFLGLYYFYCDFDTTLEKSSYVLKILFSFITLVIALKIYDRFGLNKKIAEKRTDLVVDLLIELKKIYFRIDIKTEKGTSNGPFFPRKDISQFLNNRSKEELDSKILFIIGEKDEYIKNIEILENNPLLPTTIAEKLDFLTRKGGSSPKENINSYRAKIYFSKVGAEKLSQDNGWLVEWGNDCSVKEYLTKFKDLFEEIESWIKKHSSLSDELNI